MAKRTGDAIPEFLITQLQQRESVNNKNGENAKKAYLLNANSAWIKLRSSVNSIKLPENNGDVELDKILLDRSEVFDVNTESTIAESFVLIGGTQATNTGPRAGISRRPGVQDINSAYSNFSTEYGLGFRPMPGITGLEVQSKGTYGTLLEATVKFKVFSLEDLEFCELIYFRPGYTALLEWGHSVYISNDGTVVQAGPDSSIPDNYFFSPKKLHEIDKKIQNLRTTSEGNYDGIVGFITNFSFNLQSDGSYDCDVKILSRGVILEGLKPSITSDHSTKEEDEDAEEDVRKYRSIYHYIFDAIASSNPKGPNLNLKDILTERKEKELAAKIPDDILLYAYPTDITGHYLGDDVDEIPVIYLTIGSFLRIINAVNSLGSPKRVKVDDNIIDWIFSTEAENDTATFKPKAETKDFVPFDTTPGNKFATFPDHVSVDPIVALPPAVPTGESREIAGQKGAVGMWEGFITWLGSNYYIKSAGDVFKKCTLDPLHGFMELNAKANGGTDEVLNICISTFAIEKVLDDMLTGQQDENVGIYKIVKSILEITQAALGEVNDFDLYYNHEGGRYQVVDRGYKPPGNLPVINMSGLKTTVTNLSISSTISRATSTQVAIAAQGNSGNYKENLDVIMQWNRGAIDRHMPLRMTDDSEDETALAKKKSKYLKNVMKFWDKWNDRGTFTDQDYETESIEALRSELCSDMQRIKKHFLIKEGTRPSGVVPVELSFDLHGIHGFIIGTTFKINRGLLPAKYDNWAFIVTGISHSISTDNKWITKVKTQFFPDRTSSGNSKRSVRDNLRGFIKDNPNAPTTEATIDDINIANEANADRLRAILSELGYSEKGREISNGGDISGKAANMAIAVLKQIKEDVPGVDIVVTGGNDAFHQRLPYNSRHKAGNGIDFVISPATPYNIKKVLRILQGFAAGNNPNFRFKNEYASPTKAATARHFHISWGNGTEGQKELEQALVLQRTKGIKQYNV